MRDIKPVSNTRRALFAFAVMLLFSCSIDAKPIKNQLRKHASPYLAMHGSDPVQWQDWNEKVVARAIKENKLIYISSGYFSCHWCHVMQRESYKNKKVAKILNRFFIPVKVDRELNPALDARLIDFVEKTRGRAGWPLNVFITPEGYPLVGMTYLPSENFIEVLNNLKQQWAENNTYLKGIARQATEQLLGEQPGTANKKPEKTDRVFLIQQFLSQANELMDEIQGGFGEQNKFPSVPQLRTLLHIVDNETLKPYIKTKWTDFLLTTLNSMAQQGLRDQINNGFYRYTVDPNWQIPHFEKMLYDNAQLAILYFEAGKILQRPYYKTIASQTLDFLQTDMKSDIGVIAASLSAVDAQGIEGGYYVWQQGDLVKYLSNKQFLVANKYWKLVNNDALESGYHLIQQRSITEISAELKLPVKQVQDLIHQAISRLRKIRSKKTNPIDTKPVAAWLGLSLQAFTLGYEMTANSSYRITADKLYQFIYAKLWANKTLYRSVKLVQKNMQPVGIAGLEDYALVANGVYHYSVLTRNEAARRFAVALAKQAWRRFYKKDGWYLTEKPLIKYVVGKPALDDSPLPSPSAVLIEVSSLLNNKQLNKLARTALKQGKKSIEEAPFWYASQVDVIRQFYK